MPLPEDDLEEPLDDPSDESEEDSQPAPDEVDQAVVASTDWTVETLLNQVRRGNVDLNPTFQRRDAWTVERKSRFVESLIAGIPVPQLVLAERRDRRGAYIVIDGKQRLLALAQFRGVAADSPRNGFALQRLALMPDLSSLTFSDLEESPEHNDELNAFENSTIRTVVIRNWPSEDYLYLIFHRLNTGSVPLSPQELRQALHPGDFTRYVDEFSFGNRTLMRVLRLNSPDFRMRDAELLTRAFAFSSFLSSYSGNLKQFLDDTCMRLNASWTEQSEEIERQAQQLVEGMSACMEVFGDAAFRRYGRSGYENRFNRAVFDVQMFCMDRPAMRAAAVESADAMREAYDEVARNPGFAESTGSTTKSIAATYTRLSIWAEKLNSVLSGPVPQLRLVGNRILED